jgi:transcriptional regulator
MYVPRHFVEADQSFIRDFVRKHNFGLLVTWDGSRPLATQLLFSLRELGSEALLFGHMARSNPQWRTFEQTPEALAVFEGPHAYVSAAWYSIQSAPTWNYVTVQMYGKARLIEDKDELYHLLKDLVDTQEEGTPEGQRYRLESMPRDLMESMMNSLVGFTLTVVKTECAAKLSQNRNAKDYETIISKLTERGDPSSCEVAELMKSRRDGFQRK